jgi:hypothetical protein
MCKAWSGIVLKSGEVIWEMGVDGHEYLLRLAQKKYPDLKDNESRPDHLAFARVEITPDNGDYLSPDKWTFRLDEEITPSWWSAIHEKEAWDAQKLWLKRLGKILVRKPIIHPFRDIVPPKKITKTHLALVKKWASVRASVRASVGDSVRDSVRDSVWASAGDSVWAYTGSFFSLPRDAWKYTENIKAKGYPFAPAVKLWEMGLVPSFDCKVWRLHGGPKAEILWEGKIK